MRRSRLLAAILCLAAGGVVVVQVLATPSGDPAAGFKPGSLTGKWSGSWKNTTFGGRGSIRANVRLKDGKLKPTIQFGGYVFGCKNPPPAIFSLSKGSGNNQYNSGGFKVKQNTEAFGKLKGTYTHPNNKATGSGSDVKCRPGLTWKLTGKLTSEKFTGTVQIDLGGGQRATAKLSAKKL